MNTPSEVFSLLSVKDGMINGRYFVGREELLSNLNGSVVGIQRSSAWIYGPRRIGKSSVGRALVRMAEDSGTAIVYVDAIDLADEGFIGALQRALQKSAPFSSFPKCEVKGAFEALASSSRDHPITVIFDEFDKVALSMKMNEQAFLRRLATDYEQFSYVFISCLPPGSIIEEVTEINSRILGICNQQRIMPLDRRAIHELCRRVAEDLQQKQLIEVHSLIRGFAGGFPVAVVAVLKKLAVAVYHRGLLEYEEMEEIAQSVYGELEIDLRSYWSTLKPGTRTVLMDKTEKTIFERELKEDGFKTREEGIIRPAFLLRAGNDCARRVPVAADSSLGSNDMETVNCLFKLISNINHSLKLRGACDGFYIGSHQLQFYRLTRQPCIEDEFRNCIDYLYKLFFEGARLAKDEKKYRLPPPLDEMYKKTKVIGDISNLRNFLFHDKTRHTDPEKPNKYFRQAGDIYQRHCGNREPATNSLRQEVKRSILAEMIDLLENVNKKVREL